ncbi:MAG: 30S ribosomal protein S1 [Anaerolineae bacterium]|nr:30S ribosomal protein S1 [Anaerolineae bacterium]RLC62595.1 MAG: 30S ribosomal protein S1 [Chloroflexota bacterium]
MLDENTTMTETEGEGEGRAQEAAESDYSMENLLGQAYDFKRLRRGDIVEGTIVQVSPGEVLVDVGSKSEGIISYRELERLGPEFLAQLNVGDEVLVYVITPEDRNGNVVLSFSRAQLEKDWRRAEKMFEAGEIFEGTVAGYNKGGLIVRLGKVRGFVPASQLTTRRQRAQGETLSGEDLRAQLVGQKLQLKIIELDRERNRLILSERAAMREWRRQQKAQLLADLREGDIRRGEVISLCDFGAFVDLGGADGLVHLSELSWRRVAHPSEVLKVGDEVEVYVLNVDRERKRIGLSLKRLQPDPWTQAVNKYTVGQLVEGTITKLVKFGAFARLSDDDIEGLIHISELSDQHVTHPKEVVKEGDVLTLRVIRVDAQRRRIGLSLKQVASGEYAEADWQAEYEAGLAEEEEGEPELPEYAEEQEGQEEPVAQAAEEVEEAAVEADSEGEDLPAESEVEDVSAAPDPEPVTVDHLVTEPAPLVMDQIAV